MSEQQKVAVREKLEAYAARILASDGSIESFVVAHDKQFDTGLLKGLRLPQ